MTEERELIQMMKAGRGFETFLAEYGGLVRSVVIRMVYSRREHEDIMQEIFVKIAENIGGFRGDSRLSTWVYTIAYRACIDYGKKEKRDVLLKAKDIDDHSYSSVEPTDVESTTDLERGLMRLDEKYRIFVSLKYIDGLSLKEIGAITGLGTGAVKSRIHRGIKELRDIMSNMAEVRA